MLAKQSLFIASCMCMAQASQAQCTLIAGTGVGACTFCDIQSAIMAAGPGGNVYLSPSTNITEEIFVPHDITVRTTNKYCSVSTVTPTSPAQVSGGVGRRPLTVLPGVDAVFWHIRLKNPGFVGEGGLLLVSQDATLELNEAEMIGGHATEGGGGFLESRSTLLMSDSLVDGCTAQRGGAFYLDGADGDAILSAQRTDVLQSAASEKGGAIYATSSAVSFFHDSTISQSTAGNFGGGAVWIEDDSQFALVDGSSIDGASNLGGPGGCIAAKESRVGILVDSSVHDCTSSLYGGGIWASGDGASVEVNGSQVYLSNAQQGGGIYAENGATVTVEATSIIHDNTAAEFGGGIVSRAYTAGGGDVVLRDSTVSDNFAATGAGGGVYVRGNDLMQDPTILEISGATRIDGNVSGHDGGGLYLAGRDVSATLTGNPWSWPNAAADVPAPFTTIEIVNNTTMGDGGGVCLDDINEFTAVHTVIASNSAVGLGVGYGGGLSTRGGSVTLANSVVSGNEVGFGYGGGIAMRTEPFTGDVSLEVSSDFTGCTIPGDDSWWDHYCSEIRKNTATGGPGGGVYFSGLGSASITRTGILANEADDASGMLLDGPEITLENNVSAYNIGTGYAAIDSHTQIGGYWASPSAFIRNNTFADEYGALTIYNNYTAQVDGNVVWGLNQQNDGVVVAPGATVTNKCNIGAVAGFPTHPATLLNRDLIGVDPDYEIDAFRGHFRLSATSPGVVDGCTSGPATDLEGTCRPDNCPGGPPVFLRFDRGALERP